MDNKRSNNEPSFKGKVKRQLGTDIAWVVSAAQGLMPRKPPGNQSQSVPAGSHIKKEWTSLRSTLYVAEKLLKGEMTILDSRFDGTAYETYQSRKLEQALAQLVEVSEISAEKEAEYKKAGIILQGFYARDQIRDFAKDLIEAWGQAAIEEDPDLYAKELYNNSLINIRRIFQRVQDKLQDVGESCPKQPPKMQLERRLTALERYHFSDPDLNGMAGAVRETRKCFDLVAANLSKDALPDPAAEDYKKFAESARKLSALLLNDKEKITEDKLEMFTGAVLETVQEEKRRIARMEREIDQARGLYAKLSDVLAKEESVVLLDSLDPKAGQLEGKTTDQIQQMYAPLIKQMSTIVEEYKK